VRDQGLCYVLFPLSGPVVHKFRNAACGNLVDLDFRFGKKLF